VIALRDVFDVSSSGGKAANLGEALRASLPFPMASRCRRPASINWQVVTPQRSKSYDAGFRRFINQWRFDRAQALCLNDNHLIALNRLAERCEAVHGGPQDLEWAVAAADLFLLRRRPITVTQQKAQ
jgi:phosphoenolpyruvate synthase/pyruvate phosphate dikinase